MKIRHLVIVLGDQLDPDSAVFDGFEPERDRVWMAEVGDEATHVWSHKARIALFLAAMRHFRRWLEDRGYPVHYLRLEEHDHPGLGQALGATLAELRPERVVVIEPGDYRVLQTLSRACATAGVTLEERPDRHFLCSRRAFADWLGSRRQPRLEHFYRHMRRTTGILMESGEPAGGRWNFDSENRQAFGSAGPGGLIAPLSFSPDAATRQVLEMVESRFPGHPGELSAFDWPVTREQARAALEDFIEYRLPAFGSHQDAMWTGEPFLYHACLSAALNLKLLNPREVIEAAVAAWRDRAAPLPAVEGFVRQILGWREYVRGLYWQQMPDYLEANALEADHELPPLYWDGHTDMRCLAETVGQTLRYGYAHHIQRLMVTGLFALLVGVRPRALHEWYLAIYVDAVEWVELPNTLGMSQFADGGLLGSKPYVASGRYIQRMSNYCAHCRYRPGERLGASACPFTTLYWDFLIRHEARFAGHPRTALQWRNLARLAPEERQAVGRRAQDLRRAAQAGEL